MAMRTDCKHYQSRTYPSGDTVRKCSLDLAPEAPWNCPANCDKFEIRMADVNWRHGSLVAPKTPKPPASVGEDPSIADLLDAAEDIINGAGPIIRAEVDEEQAKAASKAHRSGRRKGLNFWPFNR